MPDLLVQTTLGPIQGAFQADGRVGAFLGVPFGRAERWRKPREADKWAEVCSATEFGPAPPTLPDPLAILPIFKPSGTTEVPANGFPVLVWIFGGALAMGEASLPLYHGTNLVSKSVELNKPAILVTVNYRLNVFSFLASKEFQEWSEDGSTGNLGYCDMQLALQWVKSNIASFGGNPDNVTAFGESAGAQAVDILSAVFGEERLFRKAILQSGTAFQKPARTVAEQQPLFDLLYKNAEGPQELEGKARIEFLLGKTMEELLQAYKKCGPALTFAATLDGVLIKEQPATMPRCLEQVIVGTNKDEGTMFALAFLAGGDEGGKMFIQRSYPKDASQVLDRYSADNYGSFREAFSAYFADSTFHYPTHAFIQHAIGKGIKVYKYRFEVALKSSEKFAMGAHHAGEIPFVFAQDGLLASEEMGVAEQMLADWLCFAYDGRPGPKFPEVPKVLVYGKEETRTEEDDWRADEMAFWAAIKGKNG